MPVSWLFATVAFVRNLLYDYGLLRSREFDLPVISVGNITVGGTGKTPHVEYLLALLSQQYKVALLSRGYRRETKGFVEAKPGASAAEVGDEPAQVKRKFPGLVVAVDSKRVRGTRELLRRYPDLDVVLLDDAFQHRRINPGLSILLTDHARPMDQDHYLPYGDLRESPHEMRRAKIIVVSKTPEDLKPIAQRVIIKNLKPFPYQNLFFSSMAYGELLPIFGDKPLPAPSGKAFSLLLVSGIARPESFLEAVSGWAARAEHLEFPDHHYFRPKDLARIKSAFDRLEGSNKLLVCTEKDAMRFRDMAEALGELRPVMYYLPMKVHFSISAQAEFDKAILGYVHKSTHGPKRFTLH